MDLSLPTPGVCGLNGDVSPSDGVIGLYSAGDGA